MHFLRERYITCNVHIITALMTVYVYEMQIETRTSRSSNSAFSCFTCCFRDTTISKEESAEYSLFPENQSFTSERNASSVLVEKSTATDRCSDDELKSEVDARTFFCSELVAAALKDVSVIPKYVFSCKV